MILTKLRCEVNQNIHKLTHAGVIGTLRVLQLGHLFRYMKDTITRVKDLNKMHCRLEYLVDQD